MSSEFGPGGISSDDTLSRRGSGSSESNTDDSQPDQIDLTSPEESAEETQGTSDSDEEEGIQQEGETLGDNIHGSPNVRTSVPVNLRLCELPDVHPSIHQPDVPEEVQPRSIGHTGSVQIRNRPSSVADYIDHLEARSKPEYTFADLCSRLVTNHCDRYLHVSYIRCGNRQEFEDIVRILDGNQLRHKSTPTKYREQTFFAAAYHQSPTGTAPHVHFLHSCLWYNYQCKCAITSALKEYRIPGGYVKHISTVSPEDLLRIALYHLAGGKRQLIVQMGTEQWRLVDQAGSLQMDGHPGDPFEGLVEACGLPVSSLRKRGRRTRTDGTAESFSPSVSVGGQGARDEGVSGRGDNIGAEATTTFADLFQPAPPPRKRQRVDTLQELVSLFKSVPHCPIESILYSADFVNDKRFEHLNLSGTIVDTAFRKYKLYINELNLESIWDLSVMPSFTPAYEAPSSKTLDTYYHDFNASVVMLIELLLFQFQHDIDDVSRFLLCIYNLLNKKLGKCNTVLIFGPASSGKNFFVDAITSSMLNLGKIENPSRLNNFAFMHAHNRRVLKWDEAALDPFFADQVLNLMQGKSFLAQVKFKAPCMIHKTPLFVMGNHNPFPNEPRFNQRYVGYRWQSCPLLEKHKDKQPYPLAAAMLVLWSARHTGIDYVKVLTQIKEIRHRMLFQ
uniref:Non-structural protein 1 n=1 Tax=Motacilla cinerea parvoviridae sp. TaxID=2794518 RepID=A0A8A4XC66_9VIRU|nr:MAG: non-structural protein 1 [Motacilla cinerea parvoviridae sp.]